MSLSESQWVSVSLSESQWVSMSLNESQRVSTSLNESQWVSTKENLHQSPLFMSRFTSTEFCKCQKLHQLSFISLTFASQQMTWPKFILKSCKRLRELSPEHDSSLLTQLSFCDINKGPWYKFSLHINMAMCLITSSFLKIYKPKV